MYLINDTLWNLRLVPYESEHLLRSDGSRTVGVTDNYKKMIYVADNLQNEFLRKVITHEVVHAFCFSYNIYMPIEYEEIMANFISDYGQSILDLSEKMIFFALKEVA